MPVDAMAYRNYNLMSIGRPPLCGKLLYDNDCRVVTTAIIPQEVFDAHPWGLLGGCSFAACLRDMGSCILKHVLDEESTGAIVFVIRGASGFGKSWPINSFVTALLREGRKIVFHSGSLGRAWEVNNDGVKPFSAVTDIMFLEEDWVYWIERGSGP